MSLRMRSVLAAAFCTMAFLGPGSFSWAELRVGTAKVDLTPPATELFEPYTAIHDRIFTRAIVLDNNGAKALLMNVDVGNMTTEFADRVLAEISSKFGIPRDNMLVSAVHIHSSMPNVGGGLPGGKPMTAKMRLFVDRVTNDMVQAVADAVSSIQPAEIGFGEGRLDLNVNRDAIDAKTRMWVQGANPEFPSDKAFDVIEFRKPNSDTPIAIYINYAMHAVTMFLRGDMSADFPGVASNYLENLYDGKMVAVWTQGAEGDQNPLYMRPILAINEARIHNEMDPSKPKDDPSEYNSAIMRLFLGGSERPARPLDPKLAEESWQVVEGIGVLSAEEAIRVMGQISHYDRNPLIEGSNKVVTCPGRKRLDNAREGVEGHYEDGPPATVQVGTIRIGDIAVGHVNGEPYNKIGVETKQGSPFKATMVVALAAGGPGGGYIPTDDAYGRYTFQVLGTKFKPGCAETGIAQGIDDLLYEDLAGPNKTDR